MSEVLFSIPDHWEPTTLGEACKRGGGDVQTGPFGSQLHASDYVPVGIPSIMPQNIGDNRISEEGIARITDDDAQRLSRYLVQPGDIVYSRRGDVERRALIRDHENGWLCGTGCLRVRFGDGIVYPPYAAYYLGHPVVREWIVRHAQGATMANLNTSILSALPFVLPPPVEQTAIAHILGTLDDKIDLNRRMNETLEAMARAIFKSWFVDFDPVHAKASGESPESICHRLGLTPDVLALFPDSFQDSELGEIPAGWSVSTLGAHVDIHDSKRVPLSNREREERQGQYPYYGAAALMDHVDDYLFDGVHILMGEDGSVTNPDGTPVIQYVWGRFWVNNHAHVLTAKSPMTNEHLLLLVRDLNIAPYVTGAVQAKLSQGNLRRIPMIESPAKLNEAFGKVIAPGFTTVRELSEQTKALTEMRDALLPRLVTGELSVDVETPT